MKGTLVSGIDHSGPVPDVTCTLLNSLLSRSAPPGEGLDYQNHVLFTKNHVLCFIISLICRPFDGFWHESGLKKCANMPFWMGDLTLDWAWGAENRRNACFGGRVHVGYRSRQDFGFPKTGHLTRDRSSTRDG